MPPRRISMNTIATYHGKPFLIALVNTIICVTPSELLGQANTFAPNSQDDDINSGYNFFFYIRPGETVSKHLSVGSFTFDAGSGCALGLCAVPAPQSSEIG